MSAKSSWRNGLSPEIRRLPSKSVCKRATFFIQIVKPYDSKKRRCDYFSIPLSWKFENTLELQQGAAGGIWTHDREVSALLKPQPPMLTKLCLVFPLPHNSSEWSSFCSRREREEGRRLSAPQRPSRKNCKHMDTLSVLCFHSRVRWTGIILRYIRYRTSDLIARSHDSRIFTGNCIIFFLN